MPEPQAKIGTILDLLQKNPEATRADLAELEAATQPRRSPVIRASTLSERIRDKYYDLFESAARQPIGRIADALGLSDLQGIANERATGGKLVMATAADAPPGARTLAKVTKEAQAARALTGGFYSRVDEAAKLLPAKGVKAESLINTLKKASGGVSAEELELRGLAEFAASKRGQVVTPADLSAHLKANPAPFPTVKTLGGRNPVLYSPEGRPVPPFPATKFSQYQVPGGENYRETLLKLPEHRTPKTYTVNDWDRAVQNVYGDGKWYRVSGSGEWDAVPFDTQGQAMDAMRNQPQVTTMVPDESRNYYSSHFNDPNIVAHTRSNERTSPTGERGTFLEEVQSDWHQQGKEKGYAVKTTLADLDARINKEAEALMRQDDWPRAWIEEVDINQRADLLGLYEDRLIAQERGVVTVGVPDAPFKENWPDLSLKQALIDEANRSPDPGFLGATGGKTQINRWGTERLAWEPIGKTGNSQRPAFRVSFEPQVGGNAAGGNMGEEALRRGLIQNSSTTVHSLEELTKLLGGSEVKAEKAWKRMMAKPEGGLYQPRAEGMTEFYDKQLPAKLEKIMKPFGGSVERGEILGAPLELQHTGRGRIVKYPQPEPAWLSRLTPEMKARILKEGLPLMGLSGLTLGNLLGQEQEPVR